MKTLCLLFCSLFLVTEVCFGEESNHENLQKLLESEKNVIGIELLVAGKGPAFYSRWGHAMIRFVTFNGGLNDFTISFAALIKDSKINIIDGIRGKYSAELTVTELSKLWDKYSGKEGRDLARYIIPTNSEIRGRLFQFLKDWSASSEVLPEKYKFFKNNCATLILNLLQSSIAMDRKTNIPTKLPSVVGIVAPYSLIKMQNLSLLYKRAALKLRIPISSFTSGNWPVDSYEKLEEEFNEAELKILLLNMNLMPSEVRTKLSEKYNFRSGLTLDQAYMVDTVPELYELYELCVNVDCAKTVVRKIYERWGWPEEVRMRYLWITTQKNNLDVRYALHAQLLIDQSTEPPFGG